MSTVPDKIDPPEGLTFGEPTWEIARLYPAQGCWTEREYLDLNTNHLVEFSDGFVEFLPMPKLTHQLIAHVLHCILEAFVSTRDLGIVVGAPYKVRLWEKKYREPDVIFVRSEHASRMSEDFSDGADLVMEVVSESESDRRRDLVKKREEYARAGIPEYWIVDRELGQITVLFLDGSAYVGPRRVPAWPASHLAAPSRLYSGCHRGARGETLRRNPTTDHGGAIHHRLSRSERSRTEASAGASRTACSAARRASLRLLSASRARARW